MSRFQQFLLLLMILHAVFLSNSQSETATVLPANEAGAHINEWATVEGVVAKVFTSKSGNTFLNIGATYPNQTFTGWVPPASPVSKSPLLSGVRRKGGENHWPNRNVQRKAGNSDKREFSARGLSEENFALPKAGSSLRDGTPVDRR